MHVHFQPILITAFHLIGAAPQPDESRLCLRPALAKQFCRGNEKVEPLSFIHAAGPEDDERFGRQMEFFKHKLPAVLPGVV